MGRHALECSLGTSLDRRPATEADPDRDLTLTPKRNPTHRFVGDALSREDQLLDPGPTREQRPAQAEEARGTHLSCKDIHGQGLKGIRAQVVVRRGLALPRVPSGCSMTARISPLA